MSYLHLGAQGARLLNVTPMANSSPPRCVYMLEFAAIVLGYFARDIPVLATWLEQYCETGRRAWTIFKIFGHINICNIRMWYQVWSVWLKNKKTFDFPSIRIQNRVPVGPDSTMKNEWAQIRLSIIPNIRWNVHQILLVDIPANWSTNHVFFFFNNSNYRRNIFVVVIIFEAFNSITGHPDCHKFDRTAQTFRAMCKILMILLLSLFKKSTKFLWDLLMTLVVT